MKILGNLGGELQKQMGSKCLKVKEGDIQDATFITADPVHAPADKPLGPEAQTRRNKETSPKKRSGLQGSWIFQHTCMGYSATMQRRVRGKKFNLEDKLRKRRISRKRDSGERPYVLIKQVFKSAHILVTALKRTGVKMIFASFSYNLQQLKTLKKPT